MKLKEIRNELDKVDDQLVQLYRERLELVSKIAQAKAQEGVAVGDSQRESQIVYRLTQGLDDQYKLFVKELYATIFATSRAYQCSILGKTSSTADRLNAIMAKGQDNFPVSASVACQGVLGANSYSAACKLFPVCDVTFFKSFDGVCNAVAKGLCEYGVLPIENSTTGSVNEVYDLMKKYDFHIVKSIRLKINHCLAGIAGADKASIRKVISHPQALGQCSAYLKKLGVATQSSENTATAAKELAASGAIDVAVLCSEECAETYGLSILDRSVQDNSSNYTRFICIGKQLQVFAGSNKISVMTSLSHQPGSLNNTLSRFAALGLNLTKIESRPNSDMPFEFLFYFDFEGNIFDPKIIALIAELENNSEGFVLLGSYQEML